MAGEIGRNDDKVRNLKVNKVKEKRKKKKKGKRLFVIKLFFFEKRKQK